MSANSGSRNNRFVWAIDPFEELAALKSALPGTLLDLIATGAEIEPVYVLSGDQLGSDIEIEVENYRPAAGMALRARIAEYGLGDAARSILPPRVLLSSRPTRRGAIDTLSEYASGSGAAAIVAGTHGRTGLARVMLGSFAESLLLHSRVPVIIAGAHARADKPFREIVFASDLSQRSHEAFEDVLDLASSCGARITVLHAHPRSIEPAIAAGGYLLSGAWLSLPNLPEPGETDAENAAGKIFIERARARNIECRLVVDDEATSVTDAILGYARKTEAPLIAMAAESGPVSAALLGSVSRQVTRDAPCPVWVMPARQA